MRIIVTSDDTSIRVRRGATGTIYTDHQAQRWITWEREEDGDPTFITAIQAAKHLMVVPPPPERV